jgi:hypothetical protein
VGQATGAVVVLDTAATDCTLNVQGGTLSAPSIAVDGSSASAACLSGGQLTTQALTVQGNLRIQGGTLQAGTISTGQQTADQFAGLAAPGVPAATCPGSACPDGTNFNSGQTYRLLPGDYTQWLNVNSGSTLCLAPGTYYLDAGWNVGAALRPLGSTGCPALPAGTTDPGVTLYVHGGGTLQLNSGADLSSLSAPQSGPYAGLFYWQASGDGLYLNTPVASSGAWYAPNAALTLNSGAALSASTVIVKDLTVNGGATVTVP